MITGRGSRLLSIALCTIIGVLVVKLAVTVVGSLSQKQVSETVSVPEVMAVEQQPKSEPPKSAPKSESYALAQTDKPVKVKGLGGATGESINVLQQREQELRKKEDLLKEKEERLAKLEKEIEQKVKDLLVLQKEMLTARNEKQETQNTKVRSLAKIYGTMKPKEAAKLLENLDDRLVMGIISTMTPDEAAAILALIEVKKAAKISEALSGK
ncbi:MAG: hypothetical protein LLG06_05800 [Desulfobacteraceae bacterium]|nr:hypothetical protein [Desulfobacteraceae bacterium]